MFFYLLVGDVGDFVIVDFGWDLVLGCEQFVEGLVVVGFEFFGLCGIIVMYFYFDYFGMVCWFSEQIGVWVGMSLFDILFEGGRFVGVLEVDWDWL